MSAVKIEPAGPGVAVLWIDRPQALNALNEETLFGIKEAFEALEQDPGMRVVVLSGRGKAFVAGADIAAIHDVKDEQEGTKLAQLGQTVFNHLAKSPLVVIAAINGYALGGGLELAMAADIRLAADSARLGQPEINLGIIPGFGGTQRLARLIGEGRSLWMILSGEPVDAQTAWQLGLVDAVVPLENLMAEALRRAEVLAKKAPLALKAGKAMVRRALDVPLDQGLLAESQAFGRLAASHDGREGTEAFLQKRAAAFRGE